MKKIILSLITLAFMFGCSANSVNKEESKQTDTMTQESEKLKVTVTTSFLYDMSKNLAGDLLDVELIIPAGEDPHTYEAKPEDYNKLSGANLIFYHGLHFEGKMIELLEKSNAVSVSKDFDESLILNMVEDGNKIIDPHFWFDIDLYKQAVKTMAETLVERLPDNAELINKNTEDYLVKLDELKEYAITTIASIPEESRVLITPHDAFSYFSRQNNIVVKAPQGVSTDSEVSTNEMIETVDFIIDNKVKAVFAESTTDPARMEKLKESCAAKGFEVKVVSGEGRELFSDSLAPENNFGDTYIDMYKFNVDLIVENLK